jgi:hypothetical protein
MKKQRSRAEMLAKPKQDLENDEGALKVGLAAVHVPREALLQAAEALTKGMCHASPRMVANLSKSASLNLVFASYHLNHRPIGKHSIEPANRFRAKNPS